jgi:zinc protease
MHYENCRQSIASILMMFIFAISFGFSAGATIPKVTEQTSNSGIKYWHIEEHYLPIVSLKIIFTKSGAAYDPLNKPGLANMTANLLTEGAGGISGTEFVKQLESLATKIHFDVDEDNFYISITCLTENLDESLRLLSLALNSADFTTDALQRVRKSILTDIKKREENPETRASQIFQEKFFAGHPYSRMIDGTTPGINAIEKKDLNNFIKIHFTQKNMLIGIVGDTKTKEISPILDKYLGTLTKNSFAINDIPEFIPPANLGQIIKIEQDVPQSVILFGFIGPKRQDADFYNTYMMNYILGGGGFESRLMKEVREKKGLAYHISTSLKTYAKAGLILGSVATKNASVHETLAIVRAEIDKIHKSGVTKDELLDSQDYLVGSFPLKMTKNEELAFFITSMWRDNLGIDFLEKRNDYVRNVNVGGVHQATGKYIDPANMLVVIVGK